MYKIVGTDGKTYGPVDAGLIRQWIAQNRVERQTPVFVEGATDWTFLALRPEFAGDFNAASSSTGPGPGMPPRVAPLSANAVRQTNSLAVAGFICGILTMTCFCCCCGFPFNLLGVVFSWLALAQINRQPELYDGRWLAIIGLILSALGLLLSALMLIHQLFSSSFHYSIQGF